MVRSAVLGPAAGVLLLVIQPVPAEAASRSEIDRLVAIHAAGHRVPEALVHRVIRRESTYNPRAVSRGNFGLMQIRHGTAQGLGYRGPALGLLDAETNLRFGIAYLAGAYRVADGNHDRAVALYTRGYYYEAKRKGLEGRQMVTVAPTREAAQPEMAEASPSQAEAPSWLTALFGGQATPPATQEPARVLPVEEIYGELEKDAAPALKMRPRRGTTRVVRREPQLNRPVKMGSADASPRTDATR